MILLCYFLLLLFASVEDYKFHRVKHCWILLLFLLGVVQTVMRQENRWVTVTLTCCCFLFLCLVYYLANVAGKRLGHCWKLGGADVRLIPCMMLVQGWDIALGGILCGFLAALAYYAATGNERREIALVPWMSAGCLFIALLMFF